MISAGQEISERWLAFSSIVLAPMRLAMKRSRSGLIVRSSVETAYQLGFERQAACVCGRHSLLECPGRGRGEAKQTSASLVPDAIPGIRARYHGPYP